MKQQVASLKSERKLQLMYLHSLKIWHSVEYLNIVKKINWANLIAHSLPIVFVLLLLLDLFLIVFFNYILGKCNSKETEQSLLGLGDAVLLLLFSF